MKCPHSLTRKLLAFDIVAISLGNPRNLLCHSEMRLCVRKTIEQITAYAQENVPVIYVTYCVVKGWEQVSATKRGGSRRACKGVGGETSPLHHDDFGGGEAVEVGNGTCG